MFTEGTKGLLIGFIVDASSGVDLELMGDE